MIERSKESLINADNNTNRQRKRGCQHLRLVKGRTRETGITPERATVVQRSCKGVVWPKLGERERPRLIHTVSPERLMSQKEKIKRLSGCQESFGLEQHSSSACTKARPEMCSGSEEGSYLRLIHFVSLNSRLESKKEEDKPPAGNTQRVTKPLEERRSPRQKSRVGTSQSKSGTSVNFR